ncbi:phosphohistidine phosphatase SixA [Chamaesiphon minutus]|uniref:Phosphohistidine phosphatase SixA n=1 Tax=Chamaesiphon minutus (strain ATCC 27169 / PCC 6605) TaxID=1173020 RepID=K9UB55_CHAP6|nr:phosphohistidine phosphatase SixA [Chamaesiphon minutus]AFY92075.1 phosphohistidine phosphatase SixA [Chamaesiphon minutus PCC 6605]
MYLYLIRHGIAVDLDPLTVDAIASDELRSLTKAGRKKVAQVADRLAELELRFDLIITSPLVRARQTADILLDKQLSPTLEVSDRLKPAGTIESWLMEWSARSHDISTISTVALVGHEPNLSEWAELFLFGRSEGKIILKKSGIIGLKFTDNFKVGAAQLGCLIPPKYLLGSRS